MVTFLFTKKAKQVFLKLPKNMQKRIVEKLYDLKNHEDIFTILKRMSHFEPATHRLRIGFYRLILELRRHSKHTVEFYILDVGHRKDIYR